MCVSLIVSVYLYVFHTVPISQYELDISPYNCICTFLFPCTGVSTSICLHLFSFYTCLPVCLSLCICISLYHCISMLVSVYLCVFMSMSTYNCNCTTVCSCICIDLWMSVMVIPVGCYIRNTYWWLVTQFT